MLNPFTANFASLHNGSRYSLCHIRSNAKILLASDPRPLRTKCLV
jgi:hypothetical protein